MNDRVVTGIFVVVSLVSVLVFLVTGFPFLFLFIPFTWFLPRKSTRTAEEEVFYTSRVPVYDQYARFCPNCGYELQGFERFCPICGMKV